MTGNDKPVCLQVNSKGSLIHVCFSCRQDSDLLGADFDAVENSIPLIKRYYVNLYVFKFYNSNNVFFKCIVKLCPSGSSACDIVSKLRPCLRSFKNVNTAV